MSLTKKSSRLKVYSRRPSISKKLQQAPLVVVIGVGLKSENITEVKESLIELEELTIAAGYSLVGSATQFMDKYNPSSLLGKGKVQEIGQMADECQADIIIIDHQISGVQTRNLEKAWNKRVLDRSQIILEIFGQRAQTYEGKLQVDLAQRLDLLPRMVGAWLGSLSRQGAGIGTRGLGEKAIELDRRLIRKQIVSIKKKLERVQKQRKQQRSNRKKNALPSFAVIGYTNSGKSCLLNQLTNSKVLSKDLLFATLDPTTRKVQLSDSQMALLTDTVGFIRRLPHHLIDAFKSTLEESAEADILIHVIDLSNPQMEQQIKTVNELIDQFGWGEKPLIHAYNKIDVAPFPKRFHATGDHKVFISAHTGEGMEHLKTLMKRAIDQLAVHLELYFPIEEKGRLYELAREAQSLSQEEGPQGINCHVRLIPSRLSKWRKYISK